MALVPVMEEAGRKNGSAETRNGTHATGNALVVERASQPDLSPVDGAVRGFGPQGDRICPTCPYSERR